MGTKMGCKNEDKPKYWQRKPRKAPKQKPVQKTSKTSKRGTPGAKLRAKSQSNSMRRKDPVMDALARQCKEQAENICGMCNRWASYLEADHILPRGSHGVLRDEPLNYMALCKTCHDWKHDHPAAYTEWLEANHSGLRDRLLTIEQAKSKGVFLG